MKILKTIVLYMLFLLVMVLCGTAVMKVLDIIFQLDYENVWTIGYKVGFLSWLILSVMSFISKAKKKDDTITNGEKTID